MRLKTFFNFSQSGVASASASSREQSLGCGWYVRCPPSRPSAGVPDGNTCLFITNHDPLIFVGDLALSGPSRAPTSPPDDRNAFLI